MWPSKLKIWKLFPDEGVKKSAIPAANHMQIWLYEEHQCLEWASYMCVEGEETFSYVNASRSRQSEKHSFPYPSLQYPLFIFYFFHSAFLHPSEAPPSHCHHLPDQPYCVKICLSPSLSSHPRTRRVGNMSAPFARSNRQI
jgi:hypothetical protein